MLKRIGIRKGRRLYTNKIVEFDIIVYRILDLTSRALIETLEKENRMSKIFSWTLELILREHTELLLVKLKVILERLKEANNKLKVMEFVSEKLKRKG